MMPMLFEKVIWISEGITKDLEVVVNQILQLIFFKTGAEKEKARM